MSHRPPFTTTTEIVAYLGAHVAGYLVSWLVSMKVYPRLIESGDRAAIPYIAIVVWMVLTLAVMFLFLFIRQTLRSDTDGQA